MRANYSRKLCFRVAHKCARRSRPSTHSLLQKQKPTKMVGSCFWWGTACANRTENKQEFADLMQQVKEFKEKWLISPDGEN